MPLGTRVGDEREQRPSGDAAPLIGGLDREPALERVLLARHVALPVADGPDALGVAVDDDAEHARGALAPQSQIALVPGDERLVGLGAAEVRGHLGRVAALERGEVVVGPWHELHVCHAPHRSTRGGHAEARSHVTGLKRWVAAPPAVGGASSTTQSFVCSTPPGVTSKSSAPQQA